MSEATECTKCGQATRDAAYLCDSCTEELAKALGDCAWLDEELETTITRQKAATTSGGSRSAEHGLPWHDKASEARRALHGLLVSWVRFCDEEGVRGAPQWQAQDNLPSLSRWLLSCVRGLALHDIGGEALDEITDAVAECERIVFWKRRTRIYLGMCEQIVIDDEGETIDQHCDGDVYAEENEPVGHCEKCAQGVTVVIRKAEIETKLDLHLCTAAEIATYAVHLGLDVPRERVRKRVNYWHRHKRVLSKGTSETGDPTFRYGEVRNMLYAEFGRESA